MSETKFLYTWVVITYRSIVTLTGILGNLLILAVYWNKRSLGSAHVFISTLALCDLCSCLIIALEIHYWLNELNYTNTFLCKLFLTWERIGIDFSVCITAAIAWDRYLAVSQPINGRWTRKKAVKICLVCTVVVVVFTAAIPFLGYIEPTAIQADTGIVNGTRCEVCTKDLVSYLLGCASHYILFFLMFVATIFLYVKLWNRMNKSQDTTRMKKRRDTTSEEKEPRRDRNRGNKKYARSSKEVLEEGRDNHYLKKSSEKEVTKKKSIDTKSFNRVVPPGHSTIKTVKETKFMLSSPSSGPDMTLEGGQAIRQEAKYPAIIHNTKVNHHDRTRTIKYGNTKSQVPNRPRPISRLTKMLILATLVFVCTWSLSLVLYMTYPVWERIPRQSFAFTIIMVLVLTGGINHAINPVLYSFMNPRFRTECKMMLRRLRRRLL
ncbi:Octopamine receptor [Holothuria leucospilota]|uniref:Octopamine receptor n=1 Tax=Holothuria leucospilota TaxID=206669 RepID=A0A9Q0YE67_HOLLE|nr:Octopamine receptor [Holothuria leucospilota]